MYTIPKSARTIGTDSAGEPRVLKDEHVFRHEAAGGMARPVVMWDHAVQSAPGHDAGEHDGIRDGYAAPQRRFVRMYCSLADWLEAGNKDPRA